MTNKNKSGTTTGEPENDQSFLTQMTKWAHGNLRLTKTEHFYGNDVSVGLDVRNALGEWETVSTQRIDIPYDDMGEMGS